MKLLALLLCFFTVFSCLAGCSSNETPEINPDNEVSTVSPAPVSTEDTSSNSSSEDVESESIITEQDTTESTENETAEEIIVETNTDVPESTESYTEAVFEVTITTEVTTTTAAETVAESETTQYESDTAITESITESVETPKIPEVITAVEYSKKAISIYPEITDEYPHSIVLPKIVGESDAIATINERIMAEHGDKIDILEKNEEENLIFNIGYECFTDDNFVAILVEVLTGHQRSYRYDEYFAYYYDYINDCEVTRDEYLKAHGKDLDEILKNDAFDFGYGYVATEKDTGPVIVDGKKTIVIVKIPTGFGWSKVEV